MADEPGNWLEAVGREARRKVGGIAGLGWGAGKEGAGECWLLSFSARRKVKE